MNACVICCADDAPATRRRARQLAAELSLPLVAADDADHELLLAVTLRRLELRRPGSDMRGIACDFTSGAFGYRRRTGHLRGELLVRAAGYKGQPLSVVDATAGLGRDAAVLALAGCSVTAIERSPIIAALLDDGLARAPDLLGRITLIRADARAYLAALVEADRPDVIHVDPMFPARAKSALMKKEMRLCRLAAGDDADAAELLAVARRTARRRVVVKRPPHAPTLDAARPSFTIKGKAVRYDVYLVP